MITAKVVLASFNPYTQKTLYTVECTYPRFIHAELLTHRMFSRNASSSRAVPVQKMIDRVRQNPVYPVHWGKNQKGMQAYEQLSDHQYQQAKIVWDRAVHHALTCAEEMAAIGVHKQIANRILEPFSHIQTVITATEWDNFFNLRNHPAAQPEIRELARCIKQAMLSCPVQTLHEGCWHTPYILDSEINALDTLGRIKVSVARCARVSYFLPDSDSYSTLDKDVNLYDRLFNDKHLSPFEHCATALRQPVMVDNFDSFRSWRQFITHKTNINAESGCD